MATSKYEKEFRKKYGIISATTEENNSKKAELPDWAKKTSYSTPQPKRGYAKLPTVNAPRRANGIIPADVENGSDIEKAVKKETFADKIKKALLPQVKATPEGMNYGGRQGYSATPTQNKLAEPSVVKPTVSLPKPILHTKTPQGMYTDTSTGVKATPRKATMSGTYGKYEDDSVELGKQMVGTSTLNKDNGVAQTKDVKGTLNLTAGQRAVKDIPRNFASGLTKLASTGIQIVSQRDGSTEKLMTEQEFNAQSNLRKAGQTYDSYKRYIETKNSQNEPLKNIKALSDSLASEVNEDTTLGEKIVRGALQSVLPSAGTSAMGGGVASAVGNMTANKAVIEIARNSPLFLSSVDEGLGDADKLGLKGTERATYAVGSGLIQTITERISVPGLEGARLGLTEITKKGLRESLFDLAKSFVNEGGTEGLATFSTQIMQQFGYGVEQDWQKNIEEILVSAGSGAIMGGADVVGNMVSGVGYRTVGVDGDKVIVETTDGRVERVDPRILANYKINETKRAYLTKNQTQEAIPESNPTDTMPIQEPTINQDEFQPNNEVSTPKELKPIAEPLNEVVEETKKPKVNVREMKSFDVMRYVREGSNETAAEKPQGLYASNTFGNKEFDSYHESETDNTQRKGKVEPKNPLYVDDKIIVNNEGANKGGRRGRFGQSAGIAALEQLTTPMEYKAFMGMSKEEAIAAYNERFPNAPLTDVHFSDVHDYLAILEAYAGQLAKEKGYDSIVQQPEFGIPNGTDEIVVLDDNIIKWEDVPKTEQVMGQVPEQVPETSELDKLKSWVANVEKNEIQKSSKQNKAKYDRAKEKIKVLEKLEDIEIAEKKDKVVSTIENLNVENIGVDAKRFQFKEATDGKTGASKKLTGSDTFNQELAGVVTVWRDKSGKDWIVNGHHRLELAKRGKATNIDARILRESDGTTESEARMIGARQNIAEGTPSIKDTAQIFKEAGYTLEDIKGLGLQLKTEKIQQGYDVAQLNGRLWNNVVNKSLDEVQAAMIGSAFPKSIEGNDAKQNAIMDYLSDEGSVTKQELQEFIDMTKTSDVNYEQQDFLWGTEMVVKSNVREKAKLTAKVKQAINGEKSVYAKVVAAKNEKMLSGKGNTLNSEANKEQLDLLKDISGIIDFGKNRQSDPINETLNKYANEIQNGMKVSKAVELAIAEITETVQSGDYLKLAMEGIKETNTNEQIGMGDIVNERIETIARDNESVNQGSEREEQAEGQFNFFGEEESTVAKTEEKLVSNKMPKTTDFKKAAEDIKKSAPMPEPIDMTDAEIQGNNMDIEEVAKETALDPEYLTVGEIEYAQSKVGTKESKTKTTLLEASMPSQFAKEKLITPNEMRYNKTSESENYQMAFDTVMADYQKAYNDITYKMNDGKLLNSTEISAIDVLLMRADELYEGTNDMLYREQARSLYDSYYRYASQMGQTFHGLGMVKKLSRAGSEYILTKSVIDSRTPTQQGIAKDVESALDKLLPDDAKLPQIPDEDGKWTEPKETKKKKATLPKVKAEPKVYDDHTVLSELDKIFEEDKQTKAKKPKEPKPERVPKTPEVKSPNPEKAPTDFIGRAKYEDSTITKLLTTMEKYGVSKMWTKDMRTTLEYSPLTRDEIVSMFYDEKARISLNMKSKRTADKAQPIQKFTDETQKAILDDMSKLGVSKKWLKQLEEDMQIRGLSKDEILERFYQEKGIPHMSAEASANLQYHLDEARNLEPGTDEYNIHMNAISDIIMQNTGGSLWRKVKSGRIMSMLLNIVTPLRNEIGNWSSTLAFSPIESTVTHLADIAMSKKTGEITTVGRGKLSDYNFITNMMKDVSDLKNNVNSKSVEGKAIGATGGVFKKNTIMGQGQRILGFTMSDRRHYDSIINQLDGQIESAKAYAKAHDLKFDEMTARERGVANALEKTYNDNTSLAKWLSENVRSMNKWTEKLTGTSDFGLGSLIAPFAKTPMNLITFMGRRIPVAGAMGTVFEMAAQKHEGSQHIIRDNQNKIATMFGRQASGTALVLVGALLSAGGFITNGEDDEKVKKLLEAQGLTGSYINLSAFTRVFQTGEEINKSAGKYQEGDKLVSFSWALPIAPFLIMGARLQQATSEKEGVDMITTLQDTLGQSVGDIFEVPFARTLQTFTDKNLDTSEKFGKWGTDVVTSFIPSLLKQSAKALAPTKKKTAYIGKNALKDNVMASIPGLRNKLPDEYNVLGNTVQYFDDSIMSALFNGLVNPAYTSKVKFNKDAMTILSAYENNEIDSLPVMKEPKFSIEGKGKFILTQEQLGYFQKEYIKQFAISLSGDTATTKAKDSTVKKFNLKPQPTIADLKREKVWTENWK